MPTLIINGGASILTGTGGSGSGAITVKEDGTIVVSSATSLNFTGEVTLTDAGDGEVTISISGASSLQAAYDGGATIDTTGGGFTVNGDGYVDMGYSGTDLSSFNVGADTIDIQAVGAVAINSSGGSLSIGNDADGYAINIGTGAAARNISIGNTTASTDVQILSATGNIATDATGSIGTRVVKWDSTTNWFGSSGKNTTILSSGTVISCYNNGSFEINTQSGTGTITIGGGGSGTISIGASAFGSNSIQIGTATNSSRTIIIGNGTGSSPVTISSGTGGIAIGTNAVARSVNLGTAAAAQTVTVGSGHSTSSTTIQSGTGGVSISGTTFTVTGGSTISIGATAAARTVNLGTGAAAQTVNVGSTNTTSTTTISAGTGGITLSAPTTTVTGDLVIQGTTTSLSSETVLISDNFLYLNQGYATATAVTGGIIVNYEPTSTTDTVASGGFTAGVASTSNPTVATTGAATFSLGDIIQINGTSDPDNNGLFEVLSHSSNVLTIRGIGTTSTVETFTQDQFDTSTVVAGTITKVNVAVLRVNTSGSWESAYGSSTPLTFSALGGGAAQDYDLAGEAAGTPAALSNVYNFISGRAWTLKASGHAAACLSAPSGNTIFTIKKNGSSIGTVTFTNANTSGTVEITSAPTDVSFSIGDIFSITAPVSLNSIDTPYWTFLGTRP